eukprot:CAMPEP_0184860298 /NCGR_PEP_ID=MMETSP0580-20130426/5210_1 /TAXON_ID=1118495 /ORGANISM="Dactyliosolen fragilissimus" /LENGTH=429 /DNA_ID=CAMNT_0027357351 /DNA_START=200 /DNA_END=1486 /DNA_ORIENTATION=+
MKATKSSSSSFSAPKNIVVIGGGIQGTSVAYHISTSSSLPSDATVTIIEAKEMASAASGKGGGFMARSWGDGSPTEILHHLAFDMYEDLAKDIGVTSYRKLPVLSVRPGKDGKGLKRARDNAQLGPMIPQWLDGNTGGIDALGYGDDTAQITPKEFVEKMISSSSSNIEVILGRCKGIESDENGVVTGVKYVPRGSKSSNDFEILEADAIIVSAGPWSCQAEDWFDGAVDLPMEGVKSTSIVWKKPEAMENVDGTALFCGEDYRYNTHLECYPRNDGTIYICGIGGSDYITKQELKESAYLEECNARSDRVEAATQSFREMSKSYRTADNHGLGGELDRVQACMRPCPPDAMPYMGAIPGYTGAYINAGHNCWGIAWAPACGKAMSELVLEGFSHSVDIAPFNPARFTQNSKRGGRGRKRRGEAVGEQW